MSIGNSFAKTVLSFYDVYLAVTEDVEDDGQTLVDKLGRVVIRSPDLEEILKQLVDDVLQ
jgi:hypothetical protein